MTNWFRISKVFIFLMTCSFPEEGKKITKRQQQQPWKINKSLLFVQSQWFEMWYGVLETEAESMMMLLLFYQWKLYIHPIIAYLWEKIGNEQIGMRSHSSLNLYMLYNTTRRHHMESANSVAHNHFFKQELLNAIWLFHIYVRSTTLRTFTPMNAGMFWYTAPK